MTRGNNGIDVASNANIAAMNPPIEQLVNTEGSVWRQNGKKTEIVKQIATVSKNTIYVLN